MKYNEKLIFRVEQIFRLYSPVEAEGKDLYSYLASIVYNVPYEECQEWKDGKPYPEGKERRMRIKQMLIPIVLECGGISDDTDDIKKMIVKHRQQATNLRDSNLFDQALDCDQMANWLEELLASREYKNNGKEN